ncbi:MAG TPA: hypothetical protein VN947_11940 [Polyangia bacterium]|nr:hypothetical protein [Polyangia bacterium]
MTDEEADRFLVTIQHDHRTLLRLWQERFAEPYPGRSEALLAVARALGRRLPPSEYVLPEQTIEWLLERAGKLRGRKVPLRGAAGHKGRVGDGVERLLVGAKVSGMAADHPAAEIKSVPVAGDGVVERVKLGVLSPRSNPLAKCDRILFVFVEQRGDDFFIAGHHAHDFTYEAWTHMWRDGWIVETAAGSPERPARGLYLIPRWFRAQRIWPPTC